MRLIVFLITLYSGCHAISIDHTPLFDPTVSAKTLGLGHSNSSDQVFSMMEQNPASIIKSTGIAIHASEYQGVDYSSIIFSNAYKSLFFAVHYTGSSIPNIPRTIVENNRVIALNNTVPYEFHAMSGAIATQIGPFDVGISAQKKIMILDSQSVNQTTYSIGIQCQATHQLRMSAAIRNIPMAANKKTTFIDTHQVEQISASYQLATNSTVFISTIHNPNQYASIASIHYGLEHYMSHTIPIRFGLDHNRYTFGSGLYLAPFEIDVAWAQSRDHVIEDQLMISFTYYFDQTNKFW